MENVKKGKPGTSGTTSANQFIDTMTLVNKSYVYEFASEAYCRDHGRKKKDVVGYSVAHVFGEANFAKIIKKHLDQCFAGNVVRYENWLDIPGEEPRFYRVSYSPYFDAKGQITHAVVSSVDITSSKREEESLEKSHAAFKNILQNMHYGLFTFDTEGKFTFINDILVKRSGYPREWYIGKSLFDVVRPEERESVREHFKATVRGEQVEPYEFGFKKAADDLAWAYISTTAIRDGGKIVGVLGVVLDVTKRVKSDHALAIGEKKYRTLFENSLDAIFITDEKGRLTDVNPSFLKLFGYTKEEAQKMRAIDTYVNRDECKQYVKVINEKGFVDKFTVKLKKKDGSIMECLLNGTPLRGPEGIIAGYQGVAREIDKR